MFLPKKWLRLEEAKDRLKSEKDLNVSKSDILHLVIVGELKAYAILKEPISAEGHRLVWNSISEAPYFKECGFYLFRHFLPINRTVALDIEIYDFASINAPATFSDDPLEAFDDHENGVYWKISPSLRVDIDSIVVLNDELFQYVESIATSKKDDANKQVTDKPLSDRERETLLVIIAALAKEAKVNIAKTSKAGELIENMTQLIGARIGATTIETHLKKISQALQSRAK